MLMHSSLHAHKVRVPLGSLLLFLPLQLLENAKNAIFTSLEPCLVQSKKGLPLFDEQLKARFS